MYQLRSVELSFCTCAPTPGFRMQDFSEQYDGRVPPPNVFQCSSQLPHVQVLSLVPLMLFTFISAPRIADYGLDPCARVRYIDPIVKAVATDIL